MVIVRGHVRSHFLRIKAARAPCSPSGHASGDAGLRNNVGRAQVVQFRDPRCRIACRSQEMSNLAPRALRRGVWDCNSLTNDHETGPGPIHQALPANHAADFSADIQEQGTPIC